MKRLNACVCVGLIVLGWALTSNCQCVGSGPAECELAAGVSAYKNAQYEEAIAHFKKATELDPKLTNAELYLATAYAQQYIPGADTPDNNAWAEKAITAYSVVLEDSASEKNAIKGIAYLKLQMKKFKDAKSYYQKLIDIEPEDPEAYYSIGVIEWTQSYQARMATKAKLRLRPDEPLNNVTICRELAQEHLDGVENGIKMLAKALERRPDYDDAMAYMNLLYRERADLHCEDPASRDADLAKADEWVDATIATKKAKAEAAQKPKVDKQ